MNIDFEINKIRQWSVGDQTTPNVSQTELALLMIIQALYKKLKDLETEVEEMKRTA